MNQLTAITTRNLKNYFRDKGAVFFSLLSMLIVIGLMVFFLGDLNIENINSILSRFPGRDPAQDEANARLLVLVWTCAGILSINGVTVTLSAYSVMIKDKTSGKLGSIYTAPVSRWIITAGYIAAAWIASVIICIITLILTEIYCFSQGLTIFSAAAHIQILGMICVNAFVYASLMFLLGSLIKTEGAFSGLSTVIGTLVGFLGGIYVPIGTLSDTIVKIMKCTPVIYGTAMFRNIMTKDILDTAFLGIPAEITAEYRKTMGIDLMLFQKNTTTAQQLLLLFCCGMILLAVSTAFMKYSRLTDR